MNDKMLLTICFGHKGGLPGRLLAQTSACQVEEAMSPLSLPGQPGFKGRVEPQRSAVDLLSGMSTISDYDRFPEGLRLSNNQKVLNIINYTNWYVFKCARTHLPPLLSQLLLLNLIFDLNLDL